MASDQETSSGTYRFPIATVQKPGGKFASDAVYFEKDPKIIVLLEGGGPWSYRYAADAKVSSKTSYPAIDTIKLQQVSPVQTYRLLDLSNHCGAGTIGNPSTIKVELQTITGNQEDFDRSISVAPNPTSDVVVLKFNRPLSRKISLLNLQGNVVNQQVTRHQEHRIDAKELPSGIYIIRVEEKGKTASYKLIKL